MPDDTTQCVPDRLEELANLLVRATTILTSIPPGLQVAPVTAGELATIRQVETPEQQDRAVTEIRVAARGRLKNRIEDAVQVEIAMNATALRVLELLQLVRHSRGRAAEYARDGGNAGLDEIERSIDSATKKKKLAGAA